MKIMAHPLKEASSDGGTSTSLKFAILSASFTPPAFAPLKPAACRSPSQSGSQPPSRADTAGSIASPLLSLELANFSADVRMQVRYSPVVHPIERDTVRGELERLIHRDALQAGFVGSPGGHVGAYQPRHLESGKGERPPRERQASADMRQGGVRLRIRKSVRVLLRRTEGTSKRVHAPQRPLG